MHEYNPRLKKGQNRLCSKQRKKKDWGAFTFICINPELVIGLKQLFYQFDQTDLGRKFLDEEQTSVR